VTGSNGSGIKTRVVYQKGMQMKITLIKNAKKITFDTLSDNMHEVVDWLDGINEEVTEASIILVLRTEIEDGEYL